MKTLIIPDIHTRWHWIEKFIDAQHDNYDEIVFLGDYFDHFSDTPEMNSMTAQWLKKSLDKPKRIHLMGNHDVAYRFPNNWHLRCSGNTKDKSEAINRVLSKEDWNKIKLCHYTQGWLLSHAGVHERVFAHPRRGLNIEQIEHACQSALLDAETNVPVPEMEAGRARGGYMVVGGITWLDYREEFEPVPGINQIVGHTRHKYPSEKKAQCSENYCIDTDSNHIGVIFDGKAGVLENKFK